MIASPENWTNVSVPAFVLCRFRVEGFFVGLCTVSGKIGLRGGVASGSIS